MRLEAQVAVLPKEFKSTTGIKSYYEGEIVESTKADLYDLSLEELDKRAKSSTSPTIKRLAGAIAKEKRMGLAGGGIIAFANPNEANNQGVVKEDPELVRRAYIEAAKLKQNEIPENLRYDPEKIATQDQLIRDVGSQLNRTPAPISIRDSGGQGITEDTFKRIAARDYSGIAGATPNTAVAPAPAAAPKELPPPPANVKASALAPAAAPAAVPAAAPAGIKVAAPGQGNISPAPSDKIMPTAGIKIPGLEEPAADPYSKMSIEEIAAKKLAFLGGDVRKEERAGLMAERANAKDEARRAQSLRMAEFFAAWGSTPGSTINAGLTALKAKLPDIITDSREEAKIRRAINKDIAALDKADRLEKSGAWDEAAKIKQDQSKNAYNVWGKKVDFASARMSDDAKIRAAQIGAESRVEAAGSRASGSGFKTIQEAENALDKHLTEGNKIGSQYSTDKAIVKARKADYDAGKLDADKKKRYEDSLANVNKFESREKELRDNVEFFKKNKGMTTTSSGSSSGSSGVDLNSFWSQK
jgi:hypothetical protein